MKYNNFSFLIVTQDPITKVFTERTDWLSLALFLTVVFAVLWGVFFIYACLEYTLSSMVTQWYFADEPRRPKHFFCRGMKMMLRSAGTLVFTSCIVAIIVWIRFVFSYVYKRINKTGIKNTKVVKIVACIIKAGLYML